MRKILTIVLMMLTVACGSDTEPTTSGTSPSPSATETGSAPVQLEGQVNAHGTEDLTSMGATIETSMELDDFYFEPTFVKATPGASVDIELQNEGGSPHTFTIDGMDVNVELQAGQKMEKTFTLPSSGVVVFYCRFHGTAGMQGAFFFG